MRFVIALLLSVAAASHAAEVPAYWLWRNSDMAMVSDQSLLYVYQGDYARQGVAFTKRGVSSGRLMASHTIIPLLRVYALEDPARLAHEICRLVDEWQFLGIAVHEVQLDYDSPSSGLREYAVFLKELKLELAKQEVRFHVAISVTGLVTWLADNPKDLALLAKQSHYIHYQLYNNFQPLLRIHEYLPQLEKVNHSYKLGITTAPAFASLELPRNEHYLGTAIFLNRP